MYALREELKGNFWSSQVFSAFAHAALLASAALLPNQIKSIGEGTVSIEVISDYNPSATPPKGNQVRIQDVEDKPLDLQAPEQLVPEPKQEIAKLEQVKSEPAAAVPIVQPKAEVAKNEVAAKPLPKAKKWRPKVVQPVEVNPAPSEVSVPAESIQKAERTTERSLSQADQLAAPEIAPEEKPKALQNSVDRNLVKQKQVVSVAAPVAESARKPGKNEIHDNGRKQALAKSGSTSRQQASQPHMPYGIPSGVKNADSLKQYPGNVPPEYPVPERLARREGTVEFFAYVLDDGHLSEVRFKRSSGRTTFDKAALEAFKKYRFFPGQEGWVAKRFVFSLRGSAQDFGGRLRR